MKNQLISATEFASKIKNVVYLVKNLWKEHTTMLLHAPRQVDKTSKALEIVEEATASGREAVYVDISGSLDSHAGRVAGIKGLSVLKPAYDGIDDSRDFADLVISSIEEVISTTLIRTFIIDSVSRIAALSFGRNASAAYVMKRLVALQMRSGCSFVVIAHDSTKSSDRALAMLADTVQEVDDEVAIVECVSAEPRAEAADKPEVSPEPARKPAAKTPPSVISRRSLSRRDRRLLRRQAK